MEAAFKPLYEQKNGKWVLKVEGADEHPDVVGLRGALENERRDRSTREKELAELKAKIDGLDPEAARAALKRVAELEQQMNEGEIPTKFKEPFDKAVESRVASMRADSERQIKAYEKSLNEEKGRTKTLSEKLEELTIDNAVRAEAVKAGLHDWAVEDAVMHARGVYKLDQHGHPIPYKPGTKDEILYGKDPKSPMPVAEWLSNKVAEKPGWVKGSSGGGSGNGNGRPGGGGGGDKQFTLTKTQARDTNLYRQTREAAQKAGRQVEIVPDPA
jgi:hypothetical protein